MTSNGTQEGGTPQASVGVEAPPPSGEVPEDQEQKNGAQPIVAPAENSDAQEVAEQQPGGSSPKEEIAALKAAVAELNSALEAKASHEETQVLEATIGSLRDLFGENGARAQLEKDESEAAAQHALGNLQERVTTLGADLKDVGQTVRAGRAQEQVEPNAVPPVVLEQVYEEILTEILQEMTRLMGAGAPRRAREIMEDVRKSSSGMGFFRLVDDKRIVATGLAEAIHRGLISPLQIHVTFSQFHQQVSAEVPRYRGQRFEDLVGARTTAYSVATIRRLVDQAGELGEKLDDMVGRLDALEASMQGNGLHEREDR